MASSLPDRDLLERFGDLLARGGVSIARVDAAGTVLEAAGVDRLLAAGLLVVHGVADRIDCPREGGTDCPRQVRRFADPLTGESRVLAVCAGDVCGNVELQPGDDDRMVGDPPRVARLLARLLGVAAGDISEAGLGIQRLGTVNVSGNRIAFWLLARSDGREVSEALAVVRSATATPAGVVVVPTQGIADSVEAQDAAERSGIAVVPLPELLSLTEPATLALPIEQILAGGGRRHLSSHRRVVITGTVAEPVFTGYEGRRQTGSGDRAALGALLSYRRLASGDVVVALDYTADKKRIERELGLRGLLRSTQHVGRTDPERARAFDRPPAVKDGSDPKRWYFVEAEVIDERQDAGD